MQAYIKRNRILVMHLSFWCLYFSFFFYQITFMRRNDEIDLSKSFADAIFQVFFMALLSYLNYFLWLPRLLKHKSLGRYLIEFILPFLVIVAIHISIKKYIYSDISGRGLQYLSSIKFAITHSLTSIFIVVFVGMLKFVEDWFELDAKKKEIENEKLTAELRFLKAQINPHFLFNTLNNLYYLATVNSPKTPEVIDKLSQMMRYMLYDTNHQKVPIVKEIDYMKNYIDLEKLRLDKQVPINFVVNGSTESVFIVPLIFITFLENAFKHGVSNNSKIAFVNITIDLKGKNCTYIVENSKLPANVENTNEKSGIGLQNVNRRLDLSYPNNYNLNISENETSYKVTLSLNLE
jgi:two-component system, LytTR family, sensor histidine kinase AlgZ